MSSPEEILTATGSGEQQLVLIPQNKSESLGEFLSLVQTFSGENPGFSVYDFFDRVNEIAEYAAWSDEKRLFAARMKITGEAAKFVKTQPQVKEVKNFKEFQKALVDRFGSTNNSQNFLLQFTTAAQNVDETARAFLSRIKGLAHKCFIDEGTRDKMLVNQCLAGLQASTRRFIMTQNPKTFDAIWDLALREEECAEMEKLETVQVANEYNNQKRQMDRDGLELLMKRSLEMSETVKRLTEEVEKLSLNREQTRRDQNRETRTCFKCGNVGHVSRNCQNFHTYYQNRGNSTNRQYSYTGNREWNGDRQSEPGNYGQEHRGDRNQRGQFFGGRYNNGGRHNLNY